MHGGWKVVNKVIQERGKQKVSSVRPGVIEENQAEDGGAYAVHHVANYGGGREQ